METSRTTSPTCGEDKTAIGTFRADGILSERELLQTLDGYLKAKDALETILTSPMLGQDSETLIEKANEARELLTDAEIIFREQVARRKQIRISQPKTFHENIFELEASFTDAHNGASSIFLTVAQYTERLVTQFGPGKLVEIEGIFYWEKTQIT